MGNRRGRYARNQLLREESAWFITHGSSDPPSTQEPEIIIRCLLISYSEYCTGRYVAYLLFPRIKYTYHLSFNKLQCFFIDICVTCNPLNANFALNKTTYVYVVSIIWLVNVLLYTGTMFIMTEVLIDHMRHTLLNWDAHIWSNSGIGA